MLWDIFARQEAQAQRFGNRVVLACYAVGMIAAAVLIAVAFFNREWPGRIAMTCALVAGGLLFLPIVIVNHGNTRPGQRKGVLQLAPLLLVSVILPVLAVIAWGDFYHAWQTQFGDVTESHAHGYNISAYFLIYMMGSRYLGAFKAPAKV